MTATYIVKSPIKAGGRRHAVDERVALEDDIAAPLLELGRIEGPVDGGEPGAGKTGKTQPVAAGKRA